MLLRQNGRVFLRTLSGREFSHRLQSHVSADMREQSWRNTPRNTTIFHCLVLFGLHFGSVDHFVVSAVYVAPSDPLELLSGLQQQVTLWYCYWELFPSSEPSKETRISCLSMNSEEVKVIMESCEDSSHFVSIEVAASWGKFVRPSLHHFAKSASF